MGAEVVEIFFSFVPEDRNFYKQIRQHLRQLERDGRIHCNSSEDLGAGKEPKREMPRLLEHAAIIALLISPAYLDTDEQYQELTRAMERHQAMEARVVPILLRPGDYEDAPFARLQVLPTNRQPISQWNGQSDAAFKEIASEFKKLVQEHSATTSAVHNQ